MKTTYIILTAIFILLGIGLSAQKDTINLLNKNGHKHGYWKIFLSEKIIPTDSIHASYFAYEVYDDGQKVMSYRKIRSFTKAKMIYPTQQPEIGNPKMIDGIFKYYRNNCLVLEECFKNGYISYSKYYKKNRKTGELYISELYDFDRRYNNQVGSCYIEIAFTSTNIGSYWYRKGKKRWKDYKTDKIIEKHVSVKA